MSRCWQEQSDTKRQRRNHLRIDKALRKYHLYIYSDKDGWRPCGPLQYFVGKVSGCKVAKKLI